MLLRRLLFALAGVMLVLLAFLSGYAAYPLLHQTGAALPLTTTGAGEIVGYLTEGEVVTIVDGPFWVAGDADTIVWWYVEQPTGLRGWTPANTSQFTLLAPWAGEPQSQ